MRKWLPQKKFMKWAIIAPLVLCLVTALTNDNYSDTFDLTGFFVKLFLVCFLLGAIMTIHFNPQERCNVLKPKDELQ